MQLNKLKSGTRNGTEVSLKLSSNVVVRSNYKNNFPQRRLLTNSQDSRPHKAFANNLAANIKLSKTQLNKKVQSGGFLGRLLGPLLKTGLPLIKNVLKPLAKSVLVPLGLIATASATDAAIQNKCFGSGAHSLDLAKQTTLIISNEEMENIMKVVKSLEESGLLIKETSETIKNETKNKKVNFFQYY